MTHIQAMTPNIQTAACRIGDFMLRKCDPTVCAAPGEKRESFRVATRLSHHSSKDSSRDSSREATVEQWTYNDVVKWLADHRLAQVTNRSVVCR